MDAIAKSISKAPYTDEAVTEIAEYISEILLLACNFVYYKIKENYISGIITRGAYLAVIFTNKAITHACFTKHETFVEIDFITLADEAVALVMA